MFKLLILFTVSTLAFSSGDNFLEFRSTQDSDFKVKRSKWLVDIGAKYIGYEVEASSFDAKHVDVDAEDTLTTYSFNLGLGREFYLGYNFSLSLKGSAFIAGNSKQISGFAAEEIEDYVLATYTEEYDILGQELSASINYIFEGKVIHIQPFFELGGGRGTTEFSRNYSDKGITSAAGENSDDDYAPHEYAYSATEEFLFSRLTLGVNFLSNYNINSFIKVSQNMMSVKNRKNIRASASRGGTAVPLILPGDSGTYTALSASVGMNVTF